MTDASGLVLARPDELRLIVHPSPAGQIPVLIPEGRMDFVALVRALTMRNEPGPVPGSMGACTVSGLNNWDRIVEHRRRWEAEGGDRSDTGWQEEFRRLVPHKELYQDRFLIVSDGPYSNVSAGEIGLTEQEWQRTSTTIRLEHECTHYFTLRVFGTMHNNLLDELIADYAGITAVGPVPGRLVPAFHGARVLPGLPGGRKVAKLPGRTTPVRGRFSGFAEAREGRRREPWTPGLRSRVPAGTRYGRPGRNSACPYRLQTRRVGRPRGARSDLTGRAA